MDKMAEFKKELKTLLEKYNAGIAFSCASCSDWSGIYEECMQIYFSDAKGITEYVIENQSYFNASDL